MSTYTSSHSTRATVFIDGTVGTAAALVREMATYWVGEVLPGVWESLARDQLNRRAWRTTPDLRRPQLPSGRILIAPLPRSNC